MKCVADAANGGLILRLRDSEAEHLVSNKPHRYSYVNKSAFKQEQAYLADNRKRAPETWGMKMRKAIANTRHGRRKDGELR